MKVTADSSKLLERLAKVQKNFRSNLDSELNKAGGKFLNNAERRFSSHFSGGKFASVLSAIKNAGVEVKQTADGETTLFVADMDTLDRESILPPTKATGNVFHFWRILHEGAGMLAQTNNPHIFDAQKRSSPYPIFAIVQTTALEPLFSPGRHPPFMELIALEGQGVIIRRHEGFSGHQWFIRNLDLFDEDRTVIDKGVESAINKTIRQSEN